MTLFKYETRKTDRRRWIQYSRQPFPPDFVVSDEGLLRPESWQPPRLRHNRMRDEWVSISSSRNDRPMLPPKEYCPLCPQKNSTHTSDPVFKSEIPQSTRLYEWAVFENMFPALSLQPDGIGTCEVVLYSPDHDSTLGSQTLEHIAGLIDVWADRSASIGALPNIQYVFLFENKGPEIGVTLHHPHGQIYAFNHVPPFVQAEHTAAQTFYDTHHSCLICDIAQQELREASRIVVESKNLLAFVPAAARYPYEIHVTAKRHVPLIEQLTSIERAELAAMLKEIVARYDALFGFSMPYIMAHHQARARDEQCLSYHWHIEFYPPYRTKNKLKFLAGVESGTGFFVNDTVPEEKAAELRALKII